ncbi:MAG: hypothetical protein IJ678_00040, partial [Kiritimatiellae bacterium]|nr:hypothetical protein [Kiritimatiellia bacterium]
MNAPRGPACVSVRGARTHNLRDVSLDIPHGLVTAFVGVSGSGKSSFAFDTLFAEGRRRYLESLPSRPAAWTDGIRRPDVDFVDGLLPAAAVAQGETPPGPRQTLATEAELLDPLRIAWAHLSTPHCPSCGRVVRSVSPGALAESLLSEPEGTRMVVLSPSADIAESAGAGFVRVRVDGAIREIDSLSPEEIAAAREVDAVVDRLVVREGVRTRLVDSVELAMARSGGEIRVMLRRPGEEDWTVRNESSRFACPDCKLAFPPLAPSRFSFNSRAGACPECEGLGTDSSGRVCRACGGGRFRPEIAACRLEIPGAPGPGISLPELLALPVSAIAEKARGAARAFTAENG